MQYQCKYVSIKKIPFCDNQGCKSLCDTCKTEDCSNPIQFRSINILGVTEKHKFYITNNEPFLVVECNEGYSE